MDGEEREIGREPLLGGRKRRVENPADARARLAVAAGREDRANGHRGAGHEEPVAEIVQAGKRHVRRADMQRHEVVAETAEERGDHDEEHHQDAVGGDQNVPDVSVRRTIGLAGGEEPRALQAHVLNARIHELQAHVDSEGHRDEAGDAGGDQVEDPDVLVVRRHEPPREEPAGILVRVTVNGSIRHAVPPACSFAVE